MTNYSRVCRVEGGVSESGQFEATIATEGEADDGHILSIRGATIPETMPMLVSHFNDPTAMAGSLMHPRKELKATPPRIRMTGGIEMAGVGPTAEIRRDLALMIDKGHVGAMSVRWDEVPGKTQRRINLPSDHPYYVDPEKEDGPKRWGLYFEQWVGREASIVALGSDKAALIGRSQETEGPVSAFWRAMAQEAETDETGQAAAALAALRLHVRDCLEAGATMADIVNSIDVPEDVEPPDHGLVPYTFGEPAQRLFLPRSFVDHLRQLESPEPDPAPAKPSADLPTPEKVDSPSPQPTSADPHSSRVLEVFQQELARHDERVRGTMREIIEAAQGKVR